MSVFRDVVADVVATESELVADWLDRAAPDFSDAIKLEGLDDLLALGAGDCWYDSPAIGVNYAAWHHVQRSAGLVQPLGQILELYGQTEHLRVVDLGVGTGASLAALAGLRRADGRGPGEVSLVGIDASQIMLTTLAELAYRRAGPGPDFETFMGSWLAAEKIRAEHDGPSIVLASYLFDNTDGDPDRAAILARGLVRLAEHYDADRVLVVGGWSKAAAIEQAIAAMDQPELEVVNLIVDEEGRRQKCVPSGLDDLSTGRLGEARRRWFGSAASGRGALLGKPPPAVDKQTMAWTLHRHSTQIAVADPNPPWPRSILDARQREAALPDAGAPRYVQGAAGSGKSLTLIEHVGHLAAARIPRILVTTFNKKLADVLARDIRRRLPSAVTARNGHGHHQLAATGVAIEIINRDAIGPRLFGLPRAVVNGTLHPTKVEKAIADAEADDRLPADSLQRWHDLLDKYGDHFPLSELEAYVYGKRTRTLDEYLSLTREGAGSSRLGELQRRVIWFALEWQRDNVGPLWGHRRQQLHEWIESNEPVRRFDHIVVDEAQDFSDADFDVLLRMIASPRQLTIFADPNQAVHLGGTWKRPTLKDENGQTIRYGPVHSLEASYRLPWLVAKALEPLAASLDQDQRLMPERAALPGPRPIVVLGDATNGEMVHRLGEVGESHGFFPPDPNFGGYPVGSAGGHMATGTALSELGCDWLHLTAQEYKGCEFDAVIVHTGGAVKSVDVHDRDLYTLLTRATRLLVLAISLDTPEPTRAVLRRIDDQYLRFQDGRAREAWIASIMSPGAPVDHAEPEVQKAAEPAIEIEVEEAAQRLLQHPELDPLGVSQDLKEFVATWSGLTEDVEIEKAYRRLNVLIWTTGLGDAAEGEALDESSRFLAGLTDDQRDEFGFIKRSAVRREFIASAQPGLDEQTIARLARFTKKADKEAHAERECRYAAAGRLMLQNLNCSRGAAADVLGLSVSVLDRLLKLKKCDKVVLPFEDPIVRRHREVHSAYEMEHGVQLLESSPEEEATDWTADLAELSDKTRESLEERFPELMEKHPRAYAKWTPEEVSKLIHLCREGASVAKIVADLRRAPGGVRSRIRKLIEQGDLP